MSGPFSLFLRSSRTTLFWFALGVIVPVFALGVHGGLEARRQALDAAAADAARLAAAVSEQHRALVETARALLVVAAEQDPLLSADAACGNLLGSLAQHSPLVTTLMEARSDGQVVCSSGGATTLDEADRVAVERATLSGDLAAGPAVTGPGGAQVPIALPLAAVDAESLPLYLIARVHLAWLRDGLERLAAPDHALVMLTDADSRVLAATPRDDGLSGRLLPRTLRQTSPDASGVQFADVLMPDGERRLVALRPIDLGVRVAVGLDRGEVLAAADAAFGQAIGLLLAVAILSLALAGFIGDRYFVMPLRRVATAAGAMADGNLASRVGRISSAPGEIRDLAATFDAMATSLQARETDLEQARERVRAVIHTAQDGLFTLDANGVVRGVNPAGAAMFGHPRSALIGLPITRLIEQTPQARRLIRMAAGLREGARQSGAFRCEVIGLHRDGHSFPVRVSLGCWGQGDGVQYVAVAHDATEEKHTQAALSQAREEAERANSAKSAFLATMSHELRTPLNAILGFSETLRDGVLGPDPDGHRARDYASHIHEAGSHLLTLINDILDLSKIEAGRMEIHPEATSPGALTEGALLMVRGLAAERGVRLVADVPPGLPSLLVDRRCGRQMLVNLLSNAVRFTPRGGSVTVEARILGPGRLTLTVRDTGIGMTEEDLARALEPFGQAHTPLHADTHGTGLGLPVVKSLADLHGGRFTLTSTPGLGSTATLVLNTAVDAPHDHALTA